MRLRARLSKWLHGLAYRLVPAPRREPVKVKAYLLGGPQSGQVVETYEGAETIVFPHPTRSHISWRDEDDSIDFEPRLIEQVKYKREFVQYRYEA